MSYHKILVKKGKIRYNTMKEIYREELNKIDELEQEILQKTL